MSEEELAQDPYGKQTEAAMTLLRIVSQLTETSELPNDWAKATFEPSNGFVGDDPHAVSTRLLEPTSTLQPPAIPGNMMEWAR